MDNLEKQLSQLSDGQQSVIYDILKALLAPVNSYINDQSWLVNSRWNDEFEARLRSHHALSPAPLSREQFEIAFEAACKTRGWEVDTEFSATQRFYDIGIRRSDERDEFLKYSLKSTSAKSLKKNSIHISKLCEAAWIQDARTRRERHDRVVAEFRSYRQEVEGIIILRCFRKDHIFSYELVEIPASLFESVDSLTQAQTWEATIPIPPASEEPILKIRVDQSDAKLTIADIQLSSCIVHARWDIDLNSPGMG